MSKKPDQPRSYQEEFTLWICCGDHGLGPCGYDNDSTALACKHCAHPKCDYCQDFGMYHQVDQVVKKDKKGDGKKNADGSDEKGKDGEKKKPWLEGKAILNKGKGMA